MSEKGYTNTACDHYPCHLGVDGEFNCLFCYCPLYWTACAGTFKTFKDRNGNLRKDCSSCTIPHDGFKESWEYIQEQLGDY